jgi:hypothetical protein
MATARVVVRSSKRRLHLPMFILWSTNRRSLCYVMSSWVLLSSVTVGLQFANKSSGLFPSRKKIVRHMVLTTPESIIEQASTQKLLDDLLDESVRTSARRPIMMQFDPSSGWIWKRWQGTVFSETWDSCVKKMIYACVVLFICQKYPSTLFYTLKC